jgi:hypothetical protein
VAVTALAVVTGGWIVRRASWPERALCAVAAGLLLFLEPIPILAGLVVVVVAVAVHLVRQKLRPSLKGS